MPNPTVLLQQYILHASLLASPLEAGSIAGVSGRLLILSWLCFTVISSPNVFLPSSNLPLSAKVEQRIKLMSHSRKSCCLQMRRQKEFSAAASNRGKRFTGISFFSWLHSLAQESEALGYSVGFFLCFLKASSNQVAMECRALGRREQWITIFVGFGMIRIVWESSLAKVFLVKQEGIWEQKHEVTLLYLCYINKNNWVSC